MATRDQILKRLERRLSRVHTEELTWQDVVQAVGGSDQTTKSQIVNAIKDKKSEDLSGLILGLVLDKIEYYAKAEAASMMSNDNLSLTELERIF